MVHRPHEVSDFQEDIHVVSNADGEAIGVIAIHSTALGPAAGGCRFWHYDSHADLTADATSTAAAAVDVPAVGFSNADIAKFDDAIKTISTTRARSTSPSKGQPNVAAIVTDARLPAAWICDASCSNVSSDANVPTPWLRWLKVSLATTT